MFPNRRNMEILDERVVYRLRKWELSEIARGKSYETYSSVHFP